MATCPECGEQPSVNGGRCTECRGLSMGAVGAARCSTCDSPDVCTPTCPTYYENCRREAGVQ